MLAPRVKKYPGQCFNDCPVENHCHGRDPTPGKSPGLFRYGPAANAAGKLVGIISEKRGIVKRKMRAVPADNTLRTLAVIAPLLGSSTMGTQ